MARPIVLSNGELHIGINKFGLVHDFYYPYVGLENHSFGKDLRHRVGIWTEGQLSWLDDGAWQFTFNYPYEALIGKTTAQNDNLGILLEFNDFVDSEYNAFVRNIHVINLRDYTRDIRLFMHQGFTIGDSRSNTDTAQYLPDSKAILHYRGRRAFVISGENNGSHFDQHTIGVFGIEGYEGTYRDADDGELGFNDVEHGRVDSTIRFKLSIEAHGSGRVNYWIAAGKTTREALDIVKILRTKDAVHYRLQATADWWQNWLLPAKQTAAKLPLKNSSQFIKSLLIIKSQIDKRGAIIASTDTTMLNYSRDAYAYCWPRDAALTLWPLIRLGFKDEPQKYFEFCLRNMHPGGYMMQKFRADGGLGSSWHSYLHNGIVAPPIQEDETALTLFVFAQFYHMNPETALLDDFYDKMVVPMANFLASRIDNLTGLPKPSYDLWEQVFMITTYTTSTVYAALLEAAKLAEARSDTVRAVGWRASAEDISASAHKYLFNEARGYFYKGILAKDCRLTKYDTIDSSAVFGAFMFGLFSPASHELKTSISTLISTFGLENPSIGVPRFENDDYRREDESITGNWWFITSLWLAQYYNDVGDSAKVEAIIDWIQDKSSSSGMLAEQINPVNGQPISPSPLTWSHAEYISTLLDLVD